MPMLRRVTRDQVTDLVRAGAHTTLGEGDVLVKRGSLQDHVHLIVNGRLTGQLMDDSVSMGLGPGDLIGAEALFTRRGRALWTIVVQAPVELVTWPLAALRAQGGSPALAAMETAALGGLSRTMRKVNTETRLAWRSQDGGSLSDADQPPSSGSLWQRLRGLLGGA